MGAFPAWSVLTYVWAGSLALFIVAVVIYNVDALWRRFPDYAEDSLLIGLGGAAALVLLASSGYALSGVWQREACARTASEVVATDWRYGYANGCRVELDNDGIFIPTDNWRVTERRADR